MPVQGDTSRPSPETNKSAETRGAEKNDDGFVGSLLHTAAYDGVQAPIKGVAQIVDQATGNRTDLAKSVTFMEAPRAAEFHSAAWYGQQFGSVGKLVPFVAAYAVTHKAFLKAGLASEGQALTKGFLSGKNASTIAEVGVAGFATEAVFTPLETKGNKPLSNSEFIDGRLKNGAVGGLTFASLTAGTLALRHTGLALENAPKMTKLLTNNAFGAAVAGIPAGVIGAESHARIVEGRSATNSERVESAYSMFLVGGTLGGLSHFKRGETRSDGKSPADAKVEGRVEAGKTLPESSAVGRITEAFHQKLNNGYQKFDNFMASINPLLKGPELQPAYANAMGRNVNSLGNRAMQSTLHELGKPSVLENRSATVSGTSIEGMVDTSVGTSIGTKAPSITGRGKGVPEAFSEAVYDKSTPKTIEIQADVQIKTEKIKGDKPDKGDRTRDAVESYKKVATVLETMGLGDVAEFVKSDRTLRSQRVVRELGHGNDSPAVLELAPSKEFPNGGALKVTIPEGGWEMDWGKRPGDARILGPVREVELAGSNFSGTANVYVQELVDVRSRYSADIVEGLYNRLDSKGLDITDVGSGIEGQIGVSRSTGDLVVIDYPSVTKKGGGNETLEAIRGGKEGEQMRIDEENEAIRRGKQVEEEPLDNTTEVDIDVEVKRQQALEGNKFTPKEKEILDQLTQGFSMQEVQMMTALVEGKFDAKGNPDLKAVKPMVDSVVRRAREMGVLKKPGRSTKIEDSDSFDDY